MTSGPLRNRQQPYPLVIAGRVGSHSYASSQVPDRQYSGDRIDPHATNAKPRTALRELR